VSTPTYKLSADAGIRDIDEIWSQIIERLSSSDAVELDASEVSRPDTALAQMLAVAVVRAREQGKTVRIYHPSPRLSELLSLLAINGVLGGAA